LRQAEHFGGEAQFFDDPDAGAEQDCVHALVDRFGAAADREVIDADAADFLFDEPCGPIFRRARRPVEPFVALGALVAPAGRQEHDRVVQVSRQFLFQHGRGDECIGGDAAQVRDVRRAAPSLQRNVVQAWAAGDLVQRGIDVRTGVAGERQQFHAPAALGMVLENSGLHGRMSRAIRAAVKDRLREIDEPHGETHFLVAQAFLPVLCSLAQAGIPVPPMSNIKPGCGRLPGLRRE